MNADCLVCRELRGDVPLPGGFLLQDAVAVAFHAPPLDVRTDQRNYLGHLLVVTRRHVAGLADLDDAEAATVGRFSARLARALREGAGADWVYSTVIGTGASHFHLHLLPRYPDTPREVPWHAVDEWDGARRGSALEIAEFVDLLRTSMGSESAD